MRNVVEAARRSRPTRTVEVLGEKYVIRQPSMADIRAFNAKRAENADGAMALFLQLCVSSDGENFDMSEADAVELADMQWTSSRLLRSILRFGNGQPDQAQPGEEDDADPEGTGAPQPDAG